MPWRWFAHRDNRSEAKARAAHIAEEVQSRSKASIEANIAEIRAKRGQIVLNSILEDVLNAGIGPACDGGRHDGK